MLDLGFVLFVTFAAAGVGLRFLDRLGGRPETTTDALALAVPIGFGMLSLATLGLGEIGCLNRWGLGLILTATCAVFPVGSDWRTRPSLGPWARFPDLAFALAFVATILGTLLTALR